jgi:hypothetical protein
VKLSFPQIFDYFRESINQAPHSWIVCGMMGNFEYPALFGTGDISFNIKLTTKAMLCSDFIP